MIKKALVLLPTEPEPERSDIVSPLDRLAGLTLLQRTLSSLQWAGIGEGFLLGRDARTEREYAILEDPRNKGFSWLPSEAGREDTPRTVSDPGTAEEDFVIVFPHWIVDRDFLKDLCKTPEPLEEVVPLDPPFLCPVR